MKQVKIKKGQLLVISQIIGHAIERDRQEKMLPDGLACRFAGFVATHRDLVKTLEDEHNGLLRELGTPVMAEVAEGEAPRIQGHRLEGEKATEFQKRAELLGHEEIEIQISLMPATLFDGLTEKRIFTFDDYMAMLPIIDM